MRRRVRLIGLAKLLAGGAAFAAGFWFVMTYSREPWFGTQYRGSVGWAVVAALPGVFGIIGLLELMAGLPVRKLGKRWDAVTPWKRWLLAVAIILAAFAIVAAVFLGLAWQGII
jgi:hypothetical protein